MRRPGRTLRYNGLLRSVAPVSGFVARFDFASLTAPPPTTMSYYRRHVFFCCNQREAPEACCANHGAAAMQAYAKDRIKALGQNGKGKVRMNKSGCLDRCDEGPVLVVYPDAVWYTYVDRADIDEIIERHVLKGEIVERLRI